MSVKSAGILLYKYEVDILKILLVHPGGPFWKNKDEGGWSIPKGEYGGDEDPFEAAKREFREETGIDVDFDRGFLYLGELKQAGGKLVYVWALEKDLNTQNIKSNIFTLEWPPKTRNVREYPEIDKAEWFSLEEAREKILKSQMTLLDSLVEKLD